MCFCYILRPFKRSNLVQFILVLILVYIWSLASARLSNSSRQDMALVQTDMFEPRNALPVYLGDVLGDRYQVFRKLGFGAECTVWLARDQRTSSRRFVAVKVYSADAGGSDFRVDKALASSSGSREGEHHVEQSLDSFFGQGPSGRHICRVLEPLGRSLYSVLQEKFEKRCDLNEPEPWLGTAKEGDGWSAQSAKQICWQILKGLHYLHSRRIAHRDIQPKNVCAALQYDISSLSENEIQATIWHVQEGPGDITDKETYPINQDSSDTDSLNSAEMERRKRTEDVRKQEQEARRIIQHHWHALELNPGDKLANPSSLDWNTANFLNSRNGSRIELIRQRNGSPLGDISLKHEQIHYTVGPSPLQDGFSLEKDFRFVLVDLGFACSFEECEKQPAPGGIFDYMSPEQTLGLPTTFKGDIYSLGLLFWKIVMLRGLVEQRFDWDDPHYSRNRRLRDLAQRLGPIPSGLLQQWDAADKFVDTNGNALNNLLELDGQEYDPDDFEYGDIWYQARRRHPLDMTEVDVEVFVSLIKEMLQWTPDSRPSTSDLLWHRWFQDLQ